MPPPGSRGARMRACGAGLTARPPSGPSPPGRPAAAALRAGAWFPGSRCLGRHTSPPRPRGCSPSPSPSSPRTSRPHSGCPGCRPYKGRGGLDAPGPPRRLAPGCLALTPRPTVSPRWASGTVSTPVLRDVSAPGASPQPEHREDGHRRARMEGAQTGVCTCVRTRVWAASFWAPCFKRAPQGPLLGTWEPHSPPCQGPPGFAPADRV